MKQKKDLPDFDIDGILCVSNYEGKKMMFVNPIQMDALTDKDKLELIELLTNFIAVQIIDINSKNK
jgi:hypothetical protein